MGIRVLSWLYNARVLPGNRERQWWPVLLLWTCFVLHGVFYCVALPLWEGFDEPYQFAALQYVATTGRMPTPQTPISEDVARSLYLSPQSWMIRQHELPAPVLSYEQYWALTPQERASMRAAVLALPSSDASRPSDPPIINYEGQQAPLYYHITAPLLRLLSAASLPAQVIVARLWGLLLASLSIPLGYMLALRTVGEPRLALLATAFVVELPELYVNLCRVSNEPLAFLLCTLLLCLAVRFTDGSRPLLWLPIMGAVLGIALLAKAYFITLVPAVVVLVLLQMVRASSAQRKRIAAGAVLGLVMLVIISGAHYWGIHQATGSWSGQTDDAALGHLSRMALLHQAIHVNWRSGFGSILLSHIWFGGWSFLRLPTWIYAAVLLLALVPAFGIARYFARWAGSGARPDPIISIAVLYVFFWAGLCYHVLVTYVHLGVSASTGWYLYCLVFGEVLLIVAGIRVVFPRLFGSVLAATISLFAGIDLYGMHALMLPYYSGLIGHAGDRVRPLALMRLPLGSVFERLSSMAAPRVGSIWLWAAWAGYMISIAAVIATSWHEARNTVEIRRVR